MRNSGASCSERQHQREVDEQPEREHVGQAAEQHRRSDLRGGEPGRRVHAVAHRAAAQQRLAERMAERKRDQGRDHRLGAADAVLHVTHHDHLVGGQRRERDQRAARREQQSLARHGADVGQHVGETDPLEGSPQDVQREAGDRHAGHDAEERLQPVPARIGHGTDSRRRRADSRATVQSRMILNGIPAPHPARNIPCDSVSKLQCTA